MKGKAQNLDQASREELINYIHALESRIEKLDNHIQALEKTKCELKAGKLIELIKPNKDE